MWTVEQAYGRSQWPVGRIGLPQPWAPWGHRGVDDDEGTPNDCMYFFSWVTDDDGGRERSDYRNGSIKAYLPDRNYPVVALGTPRRGMVPSGGFLTPQQVLKCGARRGDGVLLRWSNSGTPDHIGFVTDIHGDGTVATVEANTGPNVNVFTPCGVHRRVRYASNIVGFVRPDYVKG